MYQIIKQSGKETAYLIEYITDSEGEMNKIPLEGAVAGSTCMIANSSGVKVYILGVDMQWHLA